MLVFFFMYLISFYDFHSDLPVAKISFEFQMSCWKCLLSVVWRRHVDQDFNNTLLWMDDRPEFESSNWHTELKMTHRPITQPIRSAVTHTMLRTPRNSFWENTEKYRDIISAKNTTHQGLPDGLVYEKSDRSIWHIKNDKFFQIGFYTHFLFLIQLKK